MRSIILKILNLFLKMQERHYDDKRKARLIRGNILSSNLRGKKTHLTSFASVSLSSKLDAEKKRLNSRVAELVKKNVNSPDELLNFIKKNKTEVHRLKRADKILNFIGESEGFLTPMKGFKALFLNVVLKRGFSFGTPEMFVLREMPLNIYYLSHQFHKWYGFKMKLPGYEEAAQKNFKKLWEYQDVKKIPNFEYEEIISLKEAIARDVEAIDFVLKLAKEGKGAQNAYKIMTQEGGARI